MRNIEKELKALDSLELRQKGLKMKLTDFFKTVRPVMQELADSTDAFAKAIGSLNIIVQQLEEDDVNASVAVEIKDPSAKEEIKPAPTLEQIRRVLAEKSQAGLTSKIKGLLNSFGAQKLSEIPTERYAELYEAAQELS